MSQPLDDAYGRAHALHQAGKLTEAEAIYREILRESPTEPEILRQVAACIGAQGRCAEALPFARRAVAQEPCHSGGRVVLAGVLGFLGEHEACGWELQTALKLAPDNPIARWNFGLWLLLNGDWAQGWGEYRWGLVTRDRRLRTLSGEWQGGCLIGGSTLFLWAEQGLGDTFCFLRFARQAREQSRAARVVLEVQDPLVSLLAERADEIGVDEIITQQLDGGIPCEWTAHASLMELPRLLGITPQNLRGAPYLSLPPELEGVPRREGALRAGICWKGNAAHPNDRARSLTPDLLAPLLAVEGVEWYSLVPGEAPEGTKELALSDWRATALAVGALDLVISVDTAVAHLAGAMGRPVWLLLPKVGDFRWGREGQRTPWYEFTSLFRQRAPGNWAGVILEVAAALPGLVRAYS